MTDPAGPFQVAVVDYATALEDLRAVRDAVFVQEQRVPRELERDDLDPRCRHVLARDPAGIAIGTARISPEGRIGRMAVLADWRARGVGSALLHALLRVAREDGLHQVTLHAQAGAIDFYRVHGFAPVGERFVEAGIEHLAMRFRLDHPVAIEDRATAVATTAAIVLVARRRLWIYSRELDPGLYDQPRVIEALRSFGTAGVGGEARILLQDAAAAQRAHAPLIGLAQRLPSVFALREVEDPVDRTYPSAFIASDAGGYYFRPLGHRFDGEAESHARARARQLAEGFDRVWERARPCSELRALGL
ncbi:GNAT family N-acetyltransferase [Luteimonas viscosa]|uniref:GNAT family N-acetyltransferase n=1 Tax=Luteimonas viscosa TaxID=1132694 RepID=UPI0021CCBC06|nr:GNAT family N-acetyltransferase [Luteimonas viscosa]